MERVRTRPAARATRGARRIERPEATAPPTARSESAMTASLARASPRPLPSGRSPRASRRRRPRGRPTARRRAPRRRPRWRRRSGGRSPAPGGPRPTAGRGRRSPSAPRPERMVRERRRGRESSQSAAAMPVMRQRRAPKPVCHEFRPFRGPRPSTEGAHEGAGAARMARHAVPGHPARSALCPGRVDDARVRSHGRSPGSRVIGASPPSQRLEGSSGVRRGARRSQSRGRPRPPGPGMGRPPSAFPCQAPRL